MCDWRLGDDAAGYPARPSGRARLGPDRGLTGRRRLR
jgi:hypothetical protein